MLFQDYEIIRQNVSKGEEMISKLDNIKKKLNIKNNKDFKKISIAYLSYLNRLSMVIIGTNSVNNLKFFLNSLDYPVNESQLRIISENSNFNYDWCNPRNW
jgi:aryl-alcohol dehydrogenase-like predicted oxidoreductase